MPVRIDHPCWLTSLDGQIERLRSACHCMLPSVLWYRFHAPSSRLIAAQIVWVLLGHRSRVLLQEMAKQPTKLLQRG